MTPNPGPFVDDLDDDPVAFETCPQCGEGNVDCAHSGQGWHQRCWEEFQNEYADYLATVCNPPTAGYRFLLGAVRTVQTRPVVAPVDSFSPIDEARRRRLNDLPPHPKTGHYLTHAGNADITPDDAMFLLSNGSTVEWRLIDPGMIDRHKVLPIAHIRCVTSADSFPVHLLLTSREYTIRLAYALLAAAAALK